MRHRIGGRQFGLPSDQRRALLKGLVRSLFAYDKIVTTETRAKDVKPIAEKLITTAKKNDIAARRLVRRYIDANVAEFARSADTGKIVRNPDYVLPRLFEEIAPRFKGRSGGYTRIVKIGQRRGDGAPMVLLELLDGDTVVRPTEGAEAPAAVKKAGAGK